MAAMTLSFAGCADFLDEPVRGQQELDEYFKNEDECKQQITGCYQSLAFDGWWQIYKFYLASDMCTDDMWMGNTTQPSDDYRDLAHYTGNTYGAGNCCQNFWQYRYKGILRCNLAIDRIPAVEFENENLKVRYIAEAKMLRAYEYFELIRNFGGVPIVTGLKMPNEVQGIRRSTLAESYAAVEKDLLDAIRDLPKRGEYSSSDLGRVTKGAAQGMLAKVYLYQEKYDEAEKVLQELICRGEFASGTCEYDLMEDFSQVWNLEYNNNKESLFEIQTNSDISYSLGQHISVVCGSRNDSGWAWGLPTSNLEKAYSSNDVRLQWTIIKNGQDVAGEEQDDGRNYEIKPDDHKSARVTRKLYIPKKKRPNPYDAPHNPLNYRLLRFADVLLMYAEVENKLGHDGEARWALNRVRKRAGLDEETSSGTALRNVIREERRLELALENNRLYDLRRWKDDNGKPAICNIMGKKGSFVRYNLSYTDAYEATNQKERSDKGIAFDETRDLLFPIPTTEVTMSNGSIEQNPGY